MGLVCAAAEYTTVDLTSSRLEYDSPVSPLSHRRQAPGDPVIAREPAELSLAEALGLAAGDAVALVGGGGKTTAMFRLAREIVGHGGSTLTTTTTRIFAAQIALAPVHVVAADATRERIEEALRDHRQLLVVGNMDD